MKKKALVLLLVLSLVIGTFTGLTFMTASTALAEGESTFVTKDVWGQNIIIDKGSDVYINTANFFAKSPDGELGKTRLDVDYDGDGLKAWSINVRKTGGQDGARAWFDFIGKKESLPAGTYRFTAAVCFPNATKAMDIYICIPTDIDNDKYPSAKDNNGKKYTIEPDTWTNISIEVSLPNGLSCCPGFYTKGDAAAEIFYVDDMYMGKAELKNNYITDGVELFDTNRNMGIGSLGPRYNTKLFKMLQNTQ